MTREAAGVTPHVAPQPARLNLSLLRQAVHGWWLGHPLVEARPPATIQTMAAAMIERGAQAGAVVIHADSGNAEDAAGDIQVAVLLPADQPAETVIALARETLATVAGGGYTAPSADASDGQMRFAGGSVAHFTLIPGARLSILVLALASPPGTAARASTEESRDHAPWGGRREEFIASWLRRLNLRLVALVER